MCDTGFIKFFTNDVGKRFLGFAAEQVTGECGFYTCEQTVVLDGGDGEGLEFEECGGFTRAERNGKFGEMKGRIVFLNPRLNAVFALFTSGLKYL